MWQLVTPEMHQVAEALGSTRRCAALSSRRLALPFHSFLYRHQEDALA